MTTLNDLTSLLNAGEIQQGEVLTAAAAFAQAPERQIVGLAQSAIGETRRFLPAGSVAELRSLRAEDIRCPRPSARLVRQAGRKLRYRARSARLIVPFVATRGDDATLGNEARSLAAEWLKTRKGVDANMVNPVLTAAAHFGDRALFDTMTAELKKTTDRQQRSRILGAMASFRDPAIARAGMDLVIHSEIDARESLSLLVGPLGQRETEKLPFEFVKANYDELLTHLPAGGGFDAGACCRMWAAIAATRRRARSSSGSSKSAPKSLPAGSTLTTRYSRAFVSAKPRSPPAPTDIAAFFAKQ